MTTGSRDTILKRVRSATRSDANHYGDIPRGYIVAGTLDPRAKLHLMTERLHEYGAEVVECTPAQLPSVIAHQLQLSARHHFVIPQHLPAEWLLNGNAFQSDDNLSHEEIEKCGGVVTAASAGVADSGTIVLHHGPTEGRRVISLLPDFHLCILQESQVVETLPEYFTRFPDPPRLATYISGPSATADIEMTRIKGVHGPRFLSVIIVRDEA